MEASEIYCPRNCRHLGQRGITTPDGAEIIEEFFIWVGYSTDY